MVELLNTFEERFAHALEEEAMHVAAKEQAEKTRKEDEEKERMFQRMQNELAMQQGS